MLLIPHNTEKNSFKHVSLKKTVRKYPFAKGIDYKLQLQIINVSTGYANGTQIVINLYSDDIIEVLSTNQYVGTIKSTSIVDPSVI